MEKSPVRQLFDILISDESMIVTFDSERDMQTTKIRLHQLRKEMDAQLALIGEDSIFGNKSICFKQVPDTSMTYKIYLDAINTSARTRFKIISVGATNNESIPADLGGTQD